MTRTSEEEEEEEEEEKMEEQTEWRRKDWEVLFNGAIPWNWAEKNKKRVKRRIYTYPKGTEKI